jgi:hypothetical protein
VLSSSLVENDPEIRGKEGCQCGNTENHAHLDRPLDVDEIVIFAYLPPLFFLPILRWRHPCMEWYYVSMMLHFIGIGLVCAGLFAGWIILARFRKTSEWTTRVHILRLLRPINFFLPAGGAVLILSGIGNLVWIGYGLSLPVWLQTKLAVFGAAVITGIFGDIKAKQYTRLVGEFASGNAPAKTPDSIATIDLLTRILYVVQTIFLVIILLLSIAKP